jgi:hypothetical protein
MARLFIAELRKPDSTIRQPGIAHRWWRLALSDLALTLDLPYDTDRAHPDLGLRSRPVKRRWTRSMPTPDVR